MLDYDLIPLSDQLEARLFEETDRSPAFVTKACELADALLDGLDADSEETRVRATCRLIIANRELMQAVKLLRPLATPGMDPGEARIVALEEEAAMLFRRAIRGDIGACMAFLATRDREHWGASRSNSATSKPVQTPSQIPFETKV